MRLRGLGLLALVLASGCQGTRGLYPWGKYEQTLFDVCLAPDGFDKWGAISELEELVQRAHASERRVPPGAHAFLGYLYYLNGDVDGAVAALLSERELYPESTVFIDGLLGRIGAGQWRSSP